MADAEQKTDDLICFSQGSALNCYRLSVDNKIEKLYSVLDVNEWSNVVWPTYDNKQQSLFVETHGRDKWYNCILKIDYQKGTWSKPKIIIDKGRKPSISPSGKLLAYYLHPNKLIVFALESGQEEIITNDIENRDPPIWLSEEEIVYRNTFSRVVKFNIKTKEKKFINFEKDLFPSSISPNKRCILFYSYKGNDLYLYNIATNGLELLKHCKIIAGINGGFVWLSNSEGFLFTRQIWIDVFRLRESPRLFYYDLKTKKETVLDTGQLGLFGGFSF